MNFENVANSDFIVGLDIGTTKICVVVAKKHQNGKIEILGSGQSESRGVRQGEVHNVKDTSEDIKKAVAIAEANTGVKIKDVFVGIAGAHIKSNAVRLGVTLVKSNLELIDEADVEMLRKQVENITMRPGEVLISYMPQEYFVDGVLLENMSPIGMRGNRLEANWHIISANENAEQNIRLSVELAGLNIQLIELEPMASAVAILNTEQVKEGVCLIDIGGGTTDMAIFHNGEIRHTAIFPYAGEDLTETIKTNLKLTKQVSARLKETKSATSALYTHINRNQHIAVKNMANQLPVEINRREYCRLVNMRLTQVFDLINNELISSNYHEKLNAGIILTGGGSMIPDLSALVEQITGIRTTLGIPITKITNLKDQKYADARYATVIGLAIIASQKQLKVEPVQEPIFQEFIEETEETLAGIINKGMEPETKFKWSTSLKQMMKSFMVDESMEIKDFEK